MVHWSAMFGSLWVQGIELHAKDASLPNDFVARTLWLKDPSLRAGFRRAARTPRKRLNLPKRFSASTLEIFQNNTRSLQIRSGEGAWVGAVPFFG